jgi:hypothetical protein
VNRISDGQRVNCSKSDGTGGGAADTGALVSVMGLLLVIGVIVLRLFDDGVDDIDGCCDMLLLLLLLLRLLSLSSVDRMVDLQTNDSDIMILLEQRAGIEATDTQKHRAHETNGRTDG